MPIVTTTTIVTKQPTTSSSRTTTTAAVASKKKINPASITRAAKPTKVFFDPYNSCSTGHQTAPNTLSGSTSWRDSRNRKLASQLTSNGTGGARLYDTVGAGSEGWGVDGRKEDGGWEVGAPGLRGRGQLSIVEAMGARSGKVGVENNIMRRKDGGVKGSGERSQLMGSKKQIFQGLVVYINGSTAPMVSDHRLKILLAEHGARMSIALGRRSVTHVVLGTNCGRLGGAGGGLAGGKIQKEIARVRGECVKFVGVEWVLESIKAGRRLPESQFSNLKLASKREGSVRNVFEVMGKKIEPG